jgi:glucokinase
MTVGHLVAGIDVGGTKTRAVAMDAEALIVGDVRSSTDAAGGEAVVASTFRVLTDLAELVGIAPGAFEVVGLGIPGVVNAELGTVRHAVNLGVDGHPVAVGPLLSAAAGVPVVVENDVNAAALAALALAAPAGTEDLIYLNVGTGIAAGVVLRGRVWRGRRGLAGEIGHVVVDSNGPRCRCGQRGCLEAVASGATITRRWPAAGGRRAAVALFAAAAAGDRDAIAVRDEVIGHLARAVELLAFTLDVDCIVVGGGLADVGRPLLLALRAAVTRTGREASLVEVFDLPARVHLAPAGAPLGAIGAALAARRRALLSAERAEVG